MNAKEAMQALLDGKIVTRFHNKWKLNDDGYLVVEERGIWESSGNVLNHIDGILEEYYLTFEEALRAMLDGKIVRSEVSKYMHRFNKVDSCIEYMHCEEWRVGSVTEPEQNGKWKVVE